MRYFIELSFNGTKYHGWQIQKTGISVEEVLENCLSSLLKMPVNIIGAGRTDSGVHAKQFFAHFDYPYFLTPRFIQKLNSFLPKDIKVYNIYLMQPKAHARFSALCRTYEYFISLGKSPFFKEFSWQWLSNPPDIAKMNQAAMILKRYEDFSTFCKSHSNNKTSFCKIEYSYWKYKKGLLCFQITSNRFLRNMVRSIVGTLIRVGIGKIDSKDFCQIVESKNSKMAGCSVPAKGLFLKSVSYPSDIFCITPCLLMRREIGRIL
ncbi:tRNA pseudouridine(38-40) synthase TruA [Candidatus Walczuchella endosymbiont of Icerya purchasi]|uniref:tRNA pseudouridine(38-40) synthase TruA n=1 Tax=Candidatus Walczuchella endosymbiont of Icerya purchasi TaxID=3066219 RepID=UPI00313EFD96